MSQPLPRQVEPGCCPTCGSAVRVVGGAEGTFYYEPASYGIPAGAPPTPGEVRHNDGCLHGLLGWIAGMCADEEPHHLIAAKVMEAKEIAHQLEQEAKRA